MMDQLRLMYLDAQREFTRASSKVDAYFSVHTLFQETKRCSTPCQFSTLPENMEVAP